MKLETMEELACVKVLRSQSMGSVNGIVKYIGLPKVIIMKWVFVVGLFIEIGLVFFFYVLIYMKFHSISHVKN